MKGINFPEEIITGTKIIGINEIKSHEEVVSNRVESLESYIKSLNGELIISSLIVCNQTNMIIDGHHRFAVLKRLGLDFAPVTLVNYDSPYIKAHIDNSINKDVILSACLTSNLLPPKSSKHMVFDVDKNIWVPIILISYLYYFKIV